MHPVDPDHRQPAIVLVSRAGPRGPRVRLLMAAVLMAFCATVALPQGVDHSIAQRRVDYPERKTLRPVSYDLALPRPRLPALPPGPGPRPLLPATAGSASTSSGNRALNVRPPTAADDAMIPGTALAAYQRGAAERAVLSPQCHLSWALLAAIGKIASDHANEGRLASDGTALAPVVGQQGTGTSDTARPDPDASAPDDTVLDAVGPMQLAPSAWRQWAVASRPGTAPDPNNIFDAAASVGALLCAGNRDLADPEQLSTAVLSYNSSRVYLMAVLSWTVRYAQTDSRIGLNHQLALPDTGLTPVGRDVDAPGTTPGVGGNPSVAAAPATTPQATAAPQHQEAGTPAPVAPSPQPSAPPTPLPATAPSPPMAATSSPSSPNAGTTTAPAPQAPATGSSSPTSAPTELPSPAPLPNPPGHRPTSATDRHRTLQGAW